LATPESVDGHPQRFARGRLERLVERAALPDQRQHTPGAGFPVRPQQVPHQGACDCVGALVGCPARTEEPLELGERDPAVSDQGPRQPWPVSQSHRALGRQRKPFVEPPRHRPAL